MIQIKKVTSPDELKSLSSFARAIWEEHFPRIIGMAQVQYMLTHFQSAEAMLDQIKSGYSYYRLYKNGEPCGYFAICPHEDFMYLSKFYMKAEFRRRGIGTKMMNFIENEALSSGLNKIRLNVNKHNFAVDVYKHLGFKIAYDEITKLECGFVLDDYVMEKEL